MNVVIVDYGLGNLWSVKSAFEYMGASVKVSADPLDIVDSECLVLPGVGSFGRGMDNLRARGLAESLNSAVIGKGTPILGICLGMQLFANSSEEALGIEGLGWIPGHVLKFKEKKLRLPHMGFNTAAATQNESRFFGSEHGASDFYFVHSYYFAPDDESHVLSRTEYGGSFVSAVKKNNIVGVQFHPEKSQSIGLQFIADFLKFSSCGREHG